MLHSILQPTRETRRAVAVRHEKRRQKKAGRRPSQLPLQVSGRLPPDVEATPSPEGYRHELYFCEKVAVLHAVVCSLLLGIVLLVVGLVQLTPGAEAAQYRYYLLGYGAALLIGGIIAALLRSLGLYLYNRRFQEEYEDGEQEEGSGKHKPCTTKKCRCDKNRQEKDREEQAQAKLVQNDIIIKQQSISSET